MCIPWSTDGAPSVARVLGSNVFTKLQINTNVYINILNDIK